MSFQSATKYILNDAGLYIVNAPPRSTPKRLNSSTCIKKNSLSFGQGIMGTSQKSIHPVAQSIYDKLLDAEKIERNISKTLNKVRRHDYIHPTYLITQSKLSGLGLYTVKKLKRQAKKQGFYFFCIDLGAQKSLAGFFSKMCADLKFPKPRSGVRAHFAKHLKAFFKKNSPEIKGVIIILDNIRLKNTPNDLCYHLKDSLDKICENWAEDQVVRIFYRISHVIDEQKVIHLKPFI